MRSIALIHTVKSLAVGFEDTLKKELGQDIKVHNLWDDYLANHPNEVGEFTIENRNRLFYDIKAQEMTNPDLIVTTCSTLTPVVEMIRPFIRVPVIAIDDAMARRCAAIGGKVLVMATADSTIVPTVTKLTHEAEAAGRGMEIDTCVCGDAFRALKALDMERHDQILKEKAREVKGYGCIVLAQASMAHLEEEIAAITGAEVLSSPRLCIGEIRRRLEEMGEAPAAGKR